MRTNAGIRRIILKFESHGLIFRPNNSGSLANIRLIRRGYGSARSPLSCCRWVVMSARARGCGPCGVSSLTLSVIAIAVSTQPNTMTLRIVIALGLSGPVTFLKRHHSSAVPESAC